MSQAQDRTGLELRSLVKESGELELSLVDVPIAALSEHEVLVQIEASPINPSDLGLLLSAAGLDDIRVSGTPERPVATLHIPGPAMKGLVGRVGASLPVGNEGAGKVVLAGASKEAQALLGKNVAVLGGAMYSQYRRIAAAECLVLPEDATPADGASAFVNPLTALGMVETMKREGHTALVHTAAASSLGQMLNRLCERDHIGLVSIVRKDEQAELLKTEGAKHVCNQSSATFTEDLTKAIAETGATIGFDATGGGMLAGQILASMEVALNRKAKTYSRYGSSTHKQVYIYGGLDPSPTLLNRSFGMAWGIGGWLLTPFLQKIGEEGTRALKDRVMRELKTTFATHYAKEISLAEVLSAEAIRAYGQRRTGEKFLVNPQKGLT